MSYRTSSACEIITVLAMRSVITRIGFCWAQHSCIAYTYTKGICNKKQVSSSGFFLPKGRYLSPHWNGIKGNLTHSFFSEIYGNDYASEQNVLQKHCKHMPVVGRRPWATGRRVQMLQTAPQKQKLHPRKQRRDPLALGPRWTVLLTFEPSSKTSQPHTDVNGSYFWTFNMVTEWSDS